MCRAAARPHGFNELQNQSLVARSLSEAGVNVLVPFDQFKTGLWPHARERKQDLSNNNTVGLCEPDVNPKTDFDMSILMNACRPLGVAQQPAGARTTVVMYGPRRMGTTLRESRPSNAAACLGRSHYKYPLPRS